MNRFFFLAVFLFFVRFERCACLPNSSLKRGGAFIPAVSVSKYGEKKRQQLQEQKADGTLASEEGAVLLAASSAVVGSKKTGNKNAAVVTLNAWELCFCGAIATAFGDFVMHPVDTIKVTQQAATHATSIIEVAKTIWSKNGVAGFYPGVIPYMTADGLSGAIKFATFELSKIFVEARVPAKFHPVTQFVCAAGAMIACSFIMVPGEVLKTRLQAGVVKSLGEGILSTVRNEGIGGLFAGYYATLVRDVPYTMLELGLYENIKSIIRTVTMKETLRPNEELVAAAITGGITGFVTTPLDVIKTKLMIQTATSGGQQYTGVMDALTGVYKSGGLDALFVGSAARVAWLLPFTTIYLGVYEVAKRKMLALKKKRMDLD